jgi:nucleotide-binding universal stress UspA family protein
MYTNLLVPVDGSEPSMLGLAEAIKIAKSEGAKLHLLHVMEDECETEADIPGQCIEPFADVLARGKEILAKAQRIVSEHALSAESILVEALESRAAVRIVEQARKCKADLIVMGTHGRRGLSRVLALGSDAERVVRLSPVPVLLVRGATEPT